MLENLKRIGDSVSNCADELSTLSKREALTVIDVLRAAVESSPDVLPAGPLPPVPPRLPITPPPKVAAPRRPAPSPVVDEEDDPDDDLDPDDDDDPDDLDPDEAAGMQQRAAGHPRKRGPKPPPVTEDEKTDQATQRQDRGGRALETKIRNCLLLVMKLGENATTTNIMKEWNLLSGQGVSLRMHPARSRKLVEAPPIGGKVARPWRLTGLAIEWLEKHGGLPKT